MAARAAQGESWCKFLQEWIDAASIRRRLVEILARNWNTIMKWIEAWNTCFLLKNTVTKLFDVQILWRWSHWVWTAFERLTLWFHFQKWVCDSLFDTNCKRVFFGTPVAIRNSHSIAIAPSRCFYSFLWSSKQHSAQRCLALFFWCYFFWNCVRNSLSHHHDNVNN